MEELEDISMEAPTRELKLSDEAMSYLTEISGWGRFLAIAGFVGMGLMVLAGLLFGLFYSSLGTREKLPFHPEFFGLIYFVLAMIYFFPLLYLYRFSTKVKVAVQSKDEETLTYAFQNLKSHYKYLGIMVVILLALYGLMFVGGLVAGFFFSL